MSIDAHVYRNVLDKNQVQILKEELLNLDVDNQNICSTYWLWKDEEPQNAIERYVLASYQNVIKDSNINEEDVVGFEWWVQYVKGNAYFPLHFDCDEVMSQSDPSIAKMVNPLRGTITYLDDIDEAPTVVFGVKQLSDEVSDFEDSCNGVAYSFPTSGKMLSFNTKYLHGVFPLPSYPIPRMAIMYNLWNRRLSESKDYINVSYDLAHVASDKCLYTSDTQIGTISKMNKESAIIDNTNHEYLDAEYYHNCVEMRIPSVPFKPKKGKHDFIEIKYNKEVQKWLHYTRN